MMKKFAAFCAMGFAALSAPASATSFTEVEPNDTLATAQTLIHDGSISLTGFRESSPVNGFNDFFLFSAAAGDNISFRVNAIGGGDPVIELLNSAGAFLAGDDDSGGGFNALVNYNIGTTGNYYAAVRGFANSVYNYEMTIRGLTPTEAAGVPEPATWLTMILGFALVGGTMRRRTQRQSIRFAI